MASRSNRVRWAQAWSAFAALLIVVLGAINLAQTIRRVPPPPRYAPRVPADVAMRHERRFAAVHAALETRGIRGPIGYLADLPPDKMREDPAAMQEFFLTQFALVPVVLDADVAHFTWTVANLHASSATDRLPAGFRIVEDFGDGVLLLRKENP
jgi:hypothetical protein